MMTTLIMEMIKTLVIFHKVTQVFLNNIIVMFLIITLIFQGSTVIKYNVFFYILRSKQLCVLIIHTCSFKHLVLLVLSYWCYLTTYYYKCRGT